MMMMMRRRRRRDRAGARGLSVHGLNADDDDRRREEQKHIILVDDRPRDARFGGRVKKTTTSTSKGRNVVWTKTERMTIKKCSHDSKYFCRGNERVGRTGGLAGGLAVESRSSSSKGEIWRDGEGILLRAADLKRWMGMMRRRRRVRTGSYVGLLQQYRMYSGRQEQR